MPRPTSRPRSPSDRLRAEVQAAVRPHRHRFVEMAGTNDHGLRGWFLPRTRLHRRHPRREVDLQVLVLVLDGVLLEASGLAAREGQIVFFNALYLPAALRRHGAGTRIAAAIAQLGRDVGAEQVQAAVGSDEGGLALRRWGYRVEPRTGTDRLLATAWLQLHDPREEP